MSPKSLVHIAKATVDKWSDDHAATQAAALAYYTAFSIAPMLLIAVAIAGAAFGEDAARGEIQRNLARLIGDSGAAAVQDLVANARRDRTGTIAAIVAAIGLALGATGVFVQLQETLNLVWRAPPAREGMGIKTFIRKRLLSFAMVLGIGFLLLVSLVATAVLTFVGSYVQNLLPGWEAVLTVVNIVVPFCATAAVFAAMFSYVPDKHVPWRFVWVPGIVTAALFTVGKYVLGLYLGKSALAS